MIFPHGMLSSKTACNIGILCALRKSVNKTTLLMLNNLLILFNYDIVYRFEITSLLNTCLLLLLLLL